LDSSALRTEQAAAHSGDAEATSRIPSKWHKALLFGTPVTELFRSWQENPGSRLGVAYTDPTGKWHPGYGEPGQVFGTVKFDGQAQYLMTAARIGRHPAHFSLVLGEGGDTLPRQLVTMPLGEIAIANVLPGTPIL
jgi:hypothetical protein